MNSLLTFLFVVCLLSTACLAQKITPGPTFGDYLIDCEMCDVLVAHVEGIRNSNKSFDFFKNNWYNTFCSDDALRNYFPLTKANCKKFFDVYGLKAFNEFKGGIWSDYCRKIGYCLPIRREIN